MKQQIILVRGLPGSGKTTFALKHLEENPDCMHVEADMWFETSEGYRFSPHMLTSAHTWCVTDTERHVRLEKNVIVSNTFSIAAECAPYYVIADKYDCVLTIIECAGKFGSIHGIPEVNLEMMSLRWVNNDVIKNTFLNKDLSAFHRNPYEAYQFFLTYGRVCDE